MTIRSTILPALLLMAGFLAGANSVSSQTIGGLSTPPHDTADAERVRIWFPRESTGSCRVVITIENDSGMVIRHLADFLAPTGYYNFYWDKRDDSGKWVPAGTYRYRLDNCGQERVRPIEAKYGKWEQSVDFSPYDAAHPGDITLTVMADSVPTTLAVYTQAGRPLRTIFADSVFNSGKYGLQIVPKDIGLRYGNYQIRITAGDYTFIREVTFLP